MGFEPPPRAARPVLDLTHGGAEAHLVRGRVGVGVGVRVRVRVKVGVRVRVRVRG